MLCLFSESDQLELPQYHNKVTCLNTKCYFCTETHSTFACPTPYCYCADNHCWVPLSHSNHGLVCPAQVNNIDMTKVGQANCDYCEDLLDHETSMAASFWGGSGVMTKVFFFLLTHQTHMTVYKYYQTRSYDSLIPILTHPWPCYLIWLIAYWFLSDLTHSLIDGHSAHLLMIH